MVLPPASFIGTDIDPVSIKSASLIVEQNPSLRGSIKLRLQKNPIDTFYNVLDKNERIDVSICNPPFHSSAQEAQSVNIKKTSNLADKKTDKASLNFGGQSNELWCKGGELQFVKGMIRQSKWHSDSCLWFTTLISKQSHLKNAYKALEKAEATEVKTIAMGQGNKSSRILAWTFMKKEQQAMWVKQRWQ